MLDPLLDLILKLIYAFFFAGLIGLERESKHLAAGLRTHILVCISTTAITAIVFDTYGVSDMLARLFPGILTGIGFLGAGTIVISKGQTKGLTTAAGVWTVAILGMVIGLGYFLFATVLTLVILLVLKLKFIEPSIKRKKS